MSRRQSSRQTGRQVRDRAADRPLYARLLRLRHLRPNGLLCFVYFEGVIALAILLALAELVSWWGVLVLPACVAVMVKVNDVIAGGARRQPGRRRGTVRQPSALGGAAAGRVVGDRLAARSAVPGARSAAPSGGPTGRSVTPPTQRQVTTAGSPDDVVPPAEPWWQPGSGVGAGPSRTELMPGNAHPVARQWGERGEQLTVREQWARQSGSRRYE